MKSEISLKDYGLLLLIIVPYAMLSLFSLGKFHSEQLWYGNLSGKSLTIQLATPRPISEIAYYAHTIFGQAKLDGIAVGGKTYLLVESSSLVSRLSIKWRIYDKFPSESLTAIRLTIPQPQLNISRMLIRDKNGQLITNFSVSASMTPQLDDISNLFATEESQAANYKSGIRYLDAPYFANSGMIFDEPSYAMMAYYYLQGIPLFNTTHPQLGILLTVLGIKLWGMNPFGWRFMAMLFGIATLIVVYCLAVELFAKREIALLAVLLLALDFMHFTISHIAVIEPFVTFFILLEYLFFYKYLISVKANKIARRYFYYAAICFALAVACKWIAMFSLLAIAYWGLLFEVRRQKTVGAFGKLLRHYFIGWLGIPTAIYFASYIPLFIILQSQHIWSYFIELQKIMWNFQVVNDGGALASAPWWSWPLDLYPMSIYFWFVPTTLQSHSLVLMGNPLIWWSSIVVIPFIAFDGWHKGNGTIQYLIVAILAQYLPYILVTRTSFIYYFHTLIPLICIGLAYWLKTFLYDKNHKLFFWAYILSVIILFIAFFPVISGSEINRGYVFFGLHWFNSWTF